MPKEVTIRAAEQDRGKRVDVVLAAARPDLHLSRSRIQELIRQGRITVAGRTVKPHYKLAGGETLHVAIPEVRPAGAEPEAIPLSILYEDADLIVVNKPAGMVVHPAPGNRGGTLVNALLHHCRDLSGIGGVERPGIVHRLDKDTSGVMVAAKNDEAHRHLSAQIKARKITKVYWTLVRGVVGRDQDVIQAPIGRHERHRKKMTARPRRGREAVTAYEVVERYPGATLLEVRLKTGRTHQIRVHLSLIHHPVIGDPVYGGKGYPWVRHGREERRVARQMLHSRILGFVHPRTGEYREYEAEIPADMEELIRFLGSGAAEP